MSQTIAGAAKAKQNIINRLGGEEAYHKHMQSLGKKGGTISTGGGFASYKVGKDGLTGSERAAVAGKIGGERSRRKKKV